MRRFMALLLVLTLTSIGITYADTETVRGPSYFFGDSLNGRGNLNQVLALLVGPQGPPGPAGVAGRNGFAGINGQDGRDGLPGAPGVAGPQGPAGPQGLVGPAGPAGPQGLIGATGAPGANVAVVALAIGDSNCPTGGAKLTAASGSVSYACNGAQGPIGPQGIQGLSGATGATGATGPAGTGSSGTLTSGNGQIAVGTCDDNVRINIYREFTTSGFVLKSIKVEDLSNECHNKTFQVYFKILPTPTVLADPNNKYSNSDLIQCRFTPLTLTPSLSDSATVTLTEVARASTTIPYATPLGCRVFNSESDPFNFDLTDISTADIEANIGFEIE